MKLRIGLVTIQDKNNASSFNTYCKLIDLLEPFSEEIFWIATDLSVDESKLPADVYVVKLEQKYVDEGPFIKRIFYPLIHEMKIISELRKLKNVDKFVFYGGYVPFFPFLYITFCLRRKIVIRMEGRSSVVWKKRMRPADKGNRRIRIIAHSLIEMITYALADKIAIGYESMVDIYNLQKYQRKVALGNKYVDIDVFRKTKNLPERTYHLGYFGRFSHEKGILEFAESLPSVLKDRDIRVIIMGEGTLEEQVRKHVTDAGLQDKVDFVRWIEPGKVPVYLNDTKILVVPSYAEGVPNITVEAMACGTIILATSAGGIPDVIRDEETGFLMENNSPECIARSINRVLDYPNLEDIMINARALIEEQYAYDVVIEKYRNILTD